MKEPIYFTKVMFTEGFMEDFPDSRIILDIPKKELSYQVISRKRNMPVIQGIKKFEFHSGLGTVYIDYKDFSYPAKLISDYKTGFKKVLIRDESWKEQVEFSYGVRLSQEQYEDILPLCNALDFLPYRDRTMSMDDEGFIGYRDEVTVFFSGITDSYIPMLKLPMNYYYDEDHTWPSEKLYRYIVKTYLSNKEILKQHTVYYGGLSLFF